MMKVLMQRKVITLIFILSVVVSLAFLVFNIIVGSWFGIIVHSIFIIGNGLLTIDSFKGGKVLNSIIRGLGL